MKNNKLQLVLAKRIINDKSYRTNRMRLMFDNLVFWDNKENQHLNSLSKKNIVRKCRKYILNDYNGIKIKDNP